MPTLDDLDNEIVLSPPQYDKKNEDVILGVKKQLHTAKTQQARYELSDRLFNLSTDLRIFALIRLGVKENELICSFLRCSKATVYAYRSRVRLKSMEPEKFDEMVLNL